MELREKLLSAIDNPKDWDIPGLLLDTVKLLDALDGEIEDYENTVKKLRKAIREGEPCTH